MHGRALTNNLCDGSPDEVEDSPNDPF